MERRAKVFCLLSLGLFSLSTLALASTKPAPDPAQIQRLVAELGSHQFSVRERATRQLLDRGDAAVPMLAAAANSDDPEVRWRAREILARLGRGPVDAVTPEMLAKVDALLEPVTYAGHTNLAVLVGLGQSATPALVQISQRGDDRKSIYAMLALTRVADPRAFAPLAGLFQEPALAPHLREPVAGIKDPRLLFELIKAWQKAGADATPELRRQVALMSGEKLGDDPAVWMKWFVKKYGAQSADRESGRQ